VDLTEIQGLGVDSKPFVQAGEARASRNEKIIGGGALIGALAGALSDKKHQGDHALGGAAIGAAAGTAVAAGTADTVIKIPAGKTLTFTLDSPMSVTVRK